MFDIALGIFLFLSPIITLIGNNARINGQVMALQFHQFKSLSMTNVILQSQFFQYGVIALFVIALSQKPARAFKDKWFAGFLGICAFSVLAHPKTITAFTPVFLGCLLYYLVVVYAKNLKPLVYAVFAVSTLNTFFAILQFFNIHWLYHSTGRIDGLMSISSHLGAYQAIAFPICYAISPFLSIIPLIGLLLSKSFTPIIALFIGCLYFWYPQRRKIIINLALMGIIALTGIVIVMIIRNYHPAVYKFLLRVDVWKSVLKDILNHPFIGSGIGMFSKTTTMGHWQWMYNEYLAIAFYLGLPGLFCLGMFLKDKFNGAKERAIVTSCFIVLIICLCQSPMHFARMAGTIIPLFAFMEILKRKGDEQLCL